MTKEFSEILIVEGNVSDKAIRDHQRRWVFRILAKKGVDTHAASALYPDLGVSDMRNWTDFLLRNDLDLIYDSIKNKAIFYFSKNRDIIGWWNWPEKVRSKNHRHDQHVLLFRYAEIV